MDELLKMTNIGKVEKQLNTVGIFTYDELKNIDTKNAWLRIQEIDASARIHRLFALEGSIQGIKKTYLSDEIKADLKSFIIGIRIDKNFMNLKGCNSMNNNIISNLIEYKIKTI